MKSKIFRLTSLTVAQNACAAIMDNPCDGKTQVTIGNTGTKSARQRSLDWLWNTEIAVSGYGSWDTKEEVHIHCKERFGLPILLRDDPFFSKLYETWVQGPGWIEKKKWFIENMIHTEKFSKSQMAEYLTEKQHYYINHGVYLTHPDDRGLLT